MPHSYTEDQLKEHAAIGLFAELLTAVKPALAAADNEWRDVAVKKAPGFRALSLLGPDENGLSDIIAELLDPSATHGQGETFLNLFASRCGAVGKHPKDRVTIHRESCTIFIANQRRRMDILIDGRKWGIGIENKPWAGEQKDQLQDYANDLEMRFGENFLLIRLIGWDVGATSMDSKRQAQLSAQGKFASWTYAQLRDWVDECQKHCQAPRVTAFLDELSLYFTAEFLTATNLRADMERKHLLPALESILKKDPGLLQSAAAIAEVFPKLRQEFVNRLFKEVAEDVKNDLGQAADWHVHGIDGNNFVETDNAAFAFSHQDWRELYWVQLESQPKVGRVVLGIWHHDGIKRDTNVHRVLKQFGWGTIPGGSNWDAHGPLPEPFTDWTTSAGIAAVVNQRAELKKLLTEEFVKLCSHFKTPLAKLAKAAELKRR